jgi:hypothetical protein
MHSTAGGASEAGAGRIETGEWGHAFFGGVGVSLW